MKVDIGITLFLGVLTLGLAVGVFTFLDSRPKIAGFFILEFLLCLNGFLVGILRCWLIRKGFIDNRCIYLVLMLVLLLVVFAFYLITALHAAGMALLVFGGSLEAGVMTMLGFFRLAATVPLSYFYHLTWNECWNGIEPNIPRRNSELRIRTRIYTVTSDQLEVMLLAQTYQNVRKSSPADIQPLIDQARFLFERVALFPHEQKMIKELFTKPIGNPDPSDFCSVCQMAYQEGDSVTSVGCTHQFHLGCLLEWISLRVNCPLCRREYREDLLKAALDMPN